MDAQQRCYRFLAPPCCRTAHLQALSNTAWALARLGAAPPPGLRGGGWLGAVAEASQPLLPVGVALHAVASGACVDFCRRLA